MGLTRSALHTALLALAAQPAVTSAAPPPKGVELSDATVAIGFEIKNRCPDLVQTDAQDPGATLVVLIVGPSGVPSQPSIKASSGSDTLDAAALSCVARLRFLPAVRAGEGSAVAAWEEIAWKWSRSHFAQNAPAAAPARATVTANAMAPPPPDTVVATATPAASPAAPPAPDSAEVRACADASGKLSADPTVTRSSGNADLDAAAVAVARAGAPYYRPPGSTGASACVELSIRYAP